MAIHIKEINALNLGPIKEKTLELGAFNLIYGKNERGKTLLVEFILRSMFKATPKAWGLREVTGEGKISVEGLEKDPVSFSPSTKKKLEDFLEDQNPGMPANFAKLLVVKGAELELAKGKKGGVNRAILKEFLSSEATLDEIKGGIKATVLSASIEDGDVVGSNAGEIKTFRSAREVLRAKDALLEEVDAAYSSGSRESLRRKIDGLEKDIDVVERSKRYQACVLQKEIESLEKDKADLSQETITQLQTQITAHETTSQQIDVNKNEIAELEDDSANYAWVEQAIPEYKERGAAAEGKPSRWLLVGSVIFLILTLGLMIVALTGVLNTAPGIGASIALLLVSVLFGAFYMRSQSKASQSVFDSHEFGEIKSEYESRFGEKLTNLAAMEARERQLLESQVRRQTLEEEVRKQQEGLIPVEVEIKNVLARFGKEADAGKSWTEQVNHLAERLGETGRQSAVARERLAGLGVDESEFVTEDPGVKYEKSELERFESELGTLDTKLQEDEKALDSLRQHILAEVKLDDVTVGWDELISALRESREEQAHEYRRLAAELIAKILIKDELEIIREQEDAKIQKSLRSDVLTGPLKQITGRYDSIELEGETLSVSDAYHTFTIEDLSTGAAEQVLLALRIGCASRLFGKQQLFLILDDAFQHADWDRRDLLLAEVSALAKNGWQIIYLTMDDHIRDLFDQVGKKQFKKDYMFFDLGV